MNLNTGPGQDIDNDIPANVTQRGPSSGARVIQTAIDHTSLSDSLTNLSAYTASNKNFPGITEDTRPGGESGPPTQQPLYGYYADIYSDEEIIGIPGGATHMYGLGSGGTLGNFALISAGLLVGEDDDGNPMALTVRLLDWCQLDSDTGELTPGYRYALMSQFFTSYP